MNNIPAISVVMPVYNAGIFLAAAIESILSQTFRDFEFLIINDYSTDNSDAIICSYNDSRIIYHKQPHNMGVIKAMNRGLSLAKAPYFCVMHADDIALPERLYLQKKWLDENLNTALVAGKNILIDIHNQKNGTWALDEKTIRRKDIRRMMPWKNCISHPTVMMRTNILKQYGGYDISQQRKQYAVEDYPLWLNFLSDGYSIDKIAEPILLYRIHAESTTKKHYRKQNAYRLTYNTKRLYLQQKRKQRKLNSFDRTVQISMYLDWIKAVIKDIKFMTIRK